MRRQATGEYHTPMRRKETEVKGGDRIKKSPEHSSLIETLPSSESEIYIVKQEETYYAVY
jgi:hypothetical protein